MTKIKLCGLTRQCDIKWANYIMPDFIGFVFAPKSKRYIAFDDAKILRASLSPDIIPVGVFVNESIENIEYAVNCGIIDNVQLHGGEDNQYIRKLRQSVKCPIIQAFHIAKPEDTEAAKKSEADYIMLDSRGGCGETFNHSLIGNMDRKFFLAGGLDDTNVGKAIAMVNPYAVDASSSLETNGFKDKNKMTAFVRAVRQKEEDET